MSIFNFQRNHKSSFAINNGTGKYVTPLELSMDATPGTFTMFILLKLLILLTISLLTKILLNYAVYFSIFLGGCMAASTLCIFCVVSRHISSI